MGKWIGGILAAVIIFWLTQGILDQLRQQRAEREQSAPIPTQPIAPAAVTIGYLVVQENSPWRSLGDIGTGTRVCATRETVEALRPEPALSRFDLRVLAGSELFQAWQTGVCPVVLLRERDHYSSLFPADRTGGRIIAVPR